MLPSVICYIDRVGDYKNTKNFAAGKGDGLEMKMLEIKNYTKIYGKDKVAADHVNLTVEDGDIFGFIGHNGAGKSTTIRAVVGVMDFDEGDIFIDGHSVKTEPLECKKITAYIPYNPALY